MTIDEQRTGTSMELGNTSYENVLRHSQKNFSGEGTTLCKLETVEAEIVSIQILIERSLKHLEMLKNIKAHLTPKERSDVIRIEGDGIDDTVSDRTSRASWEDVSVYGNWKEIYPDVDFYTTQEVGKITGMSLRTVRTWIKNRKLLAFRRQEGQGYLMPSIQFKNGKPLKGLAEVISAIGDPYLTWHFLRVPQFLNKKAVLPIDVLISGDDNMIMAVISVAEGFGYDFT